MKSMGGVALLQPQDSLNNRPGNSFSAPSKSHRTNKFSHPRTNSASPTPNFTDTRRRTPPKGITKKNNRFTEAAASKNQHSGPDPEMISKQRKDNRSEFFAGSVFVDLPPASSVPIPGFFLKNFAVAVRDDPTTELRRILGLSLP